MDEQIEQIVKDLKKNFEDFSVNADDLKNKSAQKRARSFSNKITRGMKDFRAASLAL